MASALLTAAGLALVVSGPVAAQEGALERYRHSATWRDRPWQPEVGRFGRAADVSSTPDGRVFVLDDRSVAGREASVHVFAPDGHGLERWLPPGQADEIALGAGRGWHPIRLDAAADGTLLLLSQGGSQAGGLSHVRIDRLRADGRLLARLERALPLPQAYVDIAAAPDGAVLLARRGANPWCIGPAGLPGREGPGPSPYAVDRFPADLGVGVGPLRTSTIEPERIFVPPALRVPLALDVDGAGRIHVAQRAPAACGDRGGEPPSPPPGWRMDEPPRARPPAILASETRPVAIARDEEDGVEGLLVLSPEGRREGMLAFAGPQDVAVGEAGLVMARHGEIFALRADGGFEETPHWSTPVGRSVDGLDASPVHALDLRADGRLLASLDDCLGQGLLWFSPTLTPTDPGSGSAPRPSTLDARLIGSPDAPELEGPVWPLRLAAAETPVVLQGRLRIGGRRPEPRYEASRLIGHDGQVVQRWNHAGGLIDQVGLCSGEGAWWARDVAVDGDVVYTLHADRVRRRDGPEQGFPAWTLWPGLDHADPDAAALLAALDARAGRLLALDQAAGEALWISETGEVLDRWPLTTSGPAVGGGQGAGGASGEAALAIDVALGHERAYLAFGGRGLVQVRDLDGAVAATWSTRDAVRAIAAGRGRRGQGSGDVSGGAGGRAADGPGDDLFVLGRGGWVFRHHADGRLVAAWPLPDRDVEATDIAVDAAGRVMVSWARLAPARNQLEQRSTPLRGAGIWLFEPDPAAVGPPPRQESPPEACTFVPDKRATPARLPLGEEVRIELSLSGRCPDRPVPLELVLLLDSSGSMASGEADARVRDAAMTLLAGLDPAFARVALVRFAAEARVLRPLGVDVASVAGDLARQRPEGASNVAAGLREAASVLAQPPATPDTRRMVLLLSDGAIAEEDSLWPARDALREQGVALHAVVFTNEALDFQHRLTLRQLLVEPERQLSDPSRATLERWLREQVLRTPTRGLIERLTITDDLPADMDYVADSARPAAAWDPSARRLTWTLAARPGQPPLGAPSLSYRVVPRRAGQRPTNLAAAAELIDARGRPARLVFPVPEVEVLPPRFTAWLPLLARAVCLRRPPPLDLVVVLDTSRSMEQPAGADEPGHTRLDAARGAVRLLAETLDARTRADDRAVGPLADPEAAHRVAVVTFDARARVAVPLVADPSRVRLGLAGLTTASGTRIDAGLRAAGELLGARGRDSRSVVLLLTDGRPDGGATGAAAARAAAETLDARRITLAFGPSRAVDLELLRALASRPGDAFHAPSEVQLRTLASALAGRLTCPDGIP